MTRSPDGGAPEGPFARLAEHLVDLRQSARLPQRALAQAANVSRGAVQRAESGTAAPSVTVLDAYLRACGAAPPDRTRAHLLRNRGRAAQRDRLRRLQAPHPTLIHTEADLGVALAAAYERAGAPSLSDGRLTPGRTPLPRTTAWRIVKRKRLPASTGQLVTFLTACGLHPTEQRPYTDAYDRITSHRGERPAPPSVLRSPADRLRLLQLFVKRLPEHFEPPTGMAATLEEFPAETLVRLLPLSLYEQASREAHLNGTVAPDPGAARYRLTHIPRLYAYDRSRSRAPDRPRRLTARQHLAIAPIDSTTKAYTPVMGAGGDEAELS